ncbi:MAG: FkbM family methyltransferase [Limisphaerales bacterium]
MKTQVARMVSRTLALTLGPRRFEALLVRACSSPHWRRRLRAGAFVHPYTAALEGHQPRAAELPGYRLWVNIREPIGYTHYFYRTHMPPPFLHGLLAEAHSFFDIGANMGSWTLFAAAAGARTARVHAFEPNPVNAGLIRRSLQDNGFTDRVVLDERALSETTGQHLTFYLSTDPQNSGQSSLVNHGHNTDPRHTLEVTTVTLDDYCAGSGVEEVDFAKIDVERAEALVVRGMAGLLARRRIHHLYVELVAGDEAHCLLRAAGYAGFVADRTAPGRWLPDGQVKEGEFLDLLFVSPDRAAAFRQRHRLAG